MITKAHIKEGLSLAYVHAVAARAGLNVQPSGIHDYGVDGTIRHVVIEDGKHFDDGYALDFQLKATVKWDFRDGFVVYDLDADAFNALSRRKRTRRALPCVLLVYCMDADEANWLDVKEDFLISRKCCYWMYVDETPTVNSGTKRLEIPRNNVFDVSALVKLMSELEEDNNDTN